MKTPQLGFQDLKATPEFTKSKIPEQMESHVFIDTKNKSVNHFNNKKILLER